MRLQLINCAAIHSFYLEMILMWTYSNDEGARRRNNQRQEEAVNVIELFGLKTVNRRFLSKRKCGVWT